MPTRTGSFAIGFRRGRGGWYDDLPGVLAWAVQNKFQSIDLTLGTQEAVHAVRASGLRLGSVDLLQMGEITHCDAGKRKAIVAANVEYVKSLAASGVNIFFTVVGGDPNLKRAENYRIAVESFAPIAEAAANSGATIAVEGYPGGAPHFAMLCTTPETCRCFLKDLPRGVSLNYDPSHLIRLGVDHLRFLKEFIENIAHVHAKDTALFPEAAYEFGLYQPSAFTPSHGFGAQVWRYSIPGHGIARWTEIFRTLLENHYRGLVSIELEDENFNGTEPGEKEGFLRSLEFLRGT